MKKMKFLFLILALIAGVMSSFSYSRKFDSIVYGVRSMTPNQPSVGLTIYHVVEVGSLDYLCTNGSDFPCIGVFTSLNTSLIRVPDGTAPYFTIVVPPSNFSTIEEGHFELQ